MIKAASALLIVGNRGPYRFGGHIVPLTQSRLADLPANPVNQLVKAEKKNLEEIAVISQNGNHCRRCDSGCLRPDRRVDCNPRPLTTLPGSPQTGRPGESCY